MGLIAPHAGYIYSGQVAAHAYKLICGKKYDAVVVIGPSHRVAFHGVSIFSRAVMKRLWGLFLLPKNWLKKLKI